MNVDGFRLSEKAGYEQTKEGKVVASDYATAANLEVQADRITAEVSRATAAEGDMSIRITQTADAITAEVTRATKSEGTLSSKITQTASEVSSKVSQTDFNGNTISSLINQNATTVTIQAQKIDLSGYCTATRIKVIEDALAATLNCNTLSAVSGYANSFTANAFYCTGSGSAAQWQSMTVVTGGRKSGQQAFALSSNGSSITGTMYATMVTDLYTDTIFYLGHT
jgi:hypothetical protein